MNTRIIIYVITAGLFFGSTAPAYAILQSQDYYGNTGYDFSGDNLAAILKHNRIETVYQYARWLGKTFSYKESKREIWVPAEVVAYRRWGNCKDFAILSDGVLRILGYDPKIFAMETEDNGHAICAYKAHNRYFYFDNLELMITNAETPAQLASILAAKFHYTKLLLMDPKTRKTRFLAFGSLTFTDDMFDKFYEQKLAAPKQSSRIVPAYERDKLPTPEATPSAEATPQASVSPVRKKSFFDSD